jgi:hypothetical protein
MDDTNIDKIEPLANVALRHRVVQRLLAALVAGKLPAGTHLVAKRLAERLGVSATPIREALVELEQMDHRYAAGRRRPRCGRGHGAAHRRRRPLPGANAIRPPAAGEVVTGDW